MATVFFMLGVGALLFTITHINQIEIPERVVVKPYPTFKPIKSKRKAKPTKPAVDPNWASAKATLVTLGFSAAEAAKLLAGINAATTEEYVSQAMNKVKI